MLKCNAYYTYNIIDYNICAKCDVFFQIMKEFATSLVYTAYLNTKVRIFWKNIINILLLPTIWLFSCNFKKSDVGKYLLKQVWDNTLIYCF